MDILEIKPGSHVTLHLSLTLPDDTEALSTFGEEPLDLVIGDGTLIQGLELALFGLKPGDKQSLTLEPELAYGLHDPSLVHEMPLADFSPEQTPARGEIIGFNTPSGDETAGMVMAVTEDSATIDFNHPLAGKEIRFEVEILSVS